MKYIKEMFKSERGRGLFKLGVFVIFFIFVAIMFHSGDSITTPVPVVEKTPFEKYSEMTNYTYQYKYLDNIIDGKMYRNILYFAIDENKYRVENDIVYLNDEVSTLDKEYLYDNHKIANLIEKDKIISKNEDYSLNIVATTYSVDVTKLDNIYDVMNITLYEQEKEINKVVISFTKEDVESLIEINYSLVNQTKIGE